MCQPDRVASNRLTEMPGISRLVALEPSHAVSCLCLLFAKTWGVFFLQRSSTKLVRNSFKCMKIFYDACRRMTREVTDDVVMIDNLPAPVGGE